MRRVEVVAVEPLDDCGAIVIVRSDAEVGELVAAPLSGANASERSWVARLDADGEVVWSTLFESSNGTSLEDVAVDGGTAYVVGETEGEGLTVARRSGVETIAVPGGQGVMLELALDDGALDTFLFTANPARFLAIERLNGVSYIAGWYRQELIFGSEALATCTSSHCSMVLRDDGASTAWVHTIEPSDGTGHRAIWSHLAVEGDRLVVGGSLVGSVDDRMLPSDRGLMVAELGLATLDERWLVMVHSSDRERLVGLRLAGEATDVFVSWTNDIMVGGSLPPVSSAPGDAHSWLRLGQGTLQRSRTWMAMLRPASSSVRDLLGTLDGHVLVAGATQARTSLDGSNAAASFVGDTSSHVNAFWAQLDTSGTRDVVLSSATLDNDAPVTNGASAQRATVVAARDGQVYLAGTFDGNGSPVPNAPPAGDSDAFIVFGAPP